MKKNKLFVLCVIILMSVSFVSAINVSAENISSGLDFISDNYYESTMNTITLPSTYEATVYFPADLTGRGGVVIGTYSNEKKPLFNFEVYTNGAPRIYINANDSNVTNYDIQFDKVNVFNGRVTHIAITLDQANGIWSCYVNGDLKQTVSKAVPKQFQFSSKVRLGGDFRAGDTQYFKGIIQKVALYKDIRTAKEIASDAKNAFFDKDNALCTYDLSSNTLGTYPQIINSQAGSAINFTYHENWIKNLTDPSDYAYSFAVIGDIQTLTRYYPEKLPVLYDWIKNNSKTKKIKFAIGLGDITDRNLASEYELVNQVHNKLSGVVPFSIIRGNHDRAGSSSAMYDKYITQAQYSSEITGSYDNTMKNTYRILQIGQVKYLFMNLDYLLKNDVITWANSIISQNKDCQVIVSTHIYMTYSGSFYKLTGSDGIGTKYGCENNGQDLWDKLLSKHENIVMLLCGHNPTDNIYYRQKTGVNGNKVTEILIDPQTTDKNHGGLGLVAMFYFSEDGKNLEVQYYSTVKNMYFKSNNQFKLTLDITEETPQIQTPVISTDSSNTDILYDKENALSATSPNNTSTDKPEANSNVGLIVSIIAVAVVVSVCITVYCLYKKKKT